MQAESFLAFLDAKLRVGAPTTLSDAMQEYINEETRRTRKWVRLCSENEALVVKAEEIGKVESVEEFEMCREAFLEAEAEVWAQQTGEDGYNEGTRPGMDDRAASR
eukprot:ANDGO_07273.mRNA.1 hypothetical protein